jgi:hypothetical protein
MISKQMLFSILILSTLSNKTLTNAVIQMFEKPMTQEEFLQALTTHPKAFKLSLKNDLFQSIPLTLTLWNNVYFVAPTKDNNDNNCLVVSNTSVMDIVSIKAHNSPEAEHTLMMNVIFNRETDFINCVYYPHAAAYNNTPIDFIFLDAENVDECTQILDDLRQQCNCYPIIQ